VAVPTACQFLLTTLVGSHAGKGEKVDHLEIAGDSTTSGWQRRSPPRIGRQIGTLIELQQPDDDFTHDAAADRPEMQAPFHDLPFFEGVVPQRR
jgi:hypothetical protein